MADLHPGDGGANSLEQYWKHGAGAMKILWGAPGDFNRCVKHVGKHVPPDEADRICAQWHHDMTGMWPGDKRNK
jgi:hypothetical protein